MSQSGDDLPEGVEIPDDLSSLEDAKPVGESGRHVEESVAAVFTPIANGRLLAAVCSLNDVQGRCIETSAGAFVMLDEATVEKSAHAARVLSAFVKSQPVLQMDRRAGQITIRRWMAGEDAGKVAPGLALNNAPGVLETLMTGVQTVDEIAMTHPGKVFEARMGKMEAFKELRRAAKDAKKRYKAMEKNKRESDPNPDGSGDD
ncbi:hypothetical protein ON058_07755 [Demequina sp. B12]|uniref:hypothetical protein n=1 Tax=Demequina sp. B12 TaxID=2992757 RepID=UPI00237AC23C|nr:hypothetical protein [Demequina sp. B12]MDE0573307.1 hypothetical protein [Demequina sp. B12]